MGISDTNTLLSGSVTSASVNKSVNASNIGKGYCVGPIIIRSRSAGISAPTKSSSGMSFERYLKNRLWYAVDDPDIFGQINRWHHTWGIDDPPFLLLRKPRAAKEIRAYGAVAARIAGTLRVWADAAAPTTRATSTRYTTSPINRSVRCRPTANSICMEMI